MALAKLGRHEEACEAYEQALYLEPTYINTHYNKGLALVELGRYEEAIRAFDEVLRLNPDDVDAYRQKGQALLALYPYIPPQQTDKAG